MKTCNLKKFAIDDRFPSRHKENQNFCWSKGLYNLDQFPGITFQGLLVVFLNPTWNLKRTSRSGSSLNVASLFFCLQTYGYSWTSSWDASTWGWRRKSPSWPSSRTFSGGGRNWSWTTANPSTRWPGAYSWGIRSRNKSMLIFFKKLCLFYLPHFKEIKKIFRYRFKNTINK